MSLQGSKWRALVGALLIFVVVVGTALAADIIFIDPFDTGQAEQIADSTTPMQIYAQAGVDILGGERDTVVGYVSGPGTVSLQVYPLPDSALAHSQQSLTKGYSTITWDGDDADGGSEVLSPTGLGGLDLTNSGKSDRFWIYVISCDRGTTLTVDVYTDGSNWSRATIAVPANTYDTNVALPFSSLVAQAGTGANMTSVGAIVLDIDGRTTNDLDVTIDWFSPGGPTAVSLAAFDAAAAGSSVQLTWETASELDNLGFNLYRATSLAGVRSRLNTSLIASQAPGSAAGAAYSFADEAVSAGATYYYWLEAVDVNGGTSLQGPVSAQASYLRRFLPARPRVEPLPSIQRSR